MTSLRSTRFIFKFLCALSLAVPLLAVADYPDKPIKLIVPFPPGAGTDATARLIANALSTQMKQTIVVENRAGAGGAMGAQTVVDSAPDGYTLFFATTGTLAFNQHLYAKLRYNPLTDFSPIAGVASFPNVLVMHPSVPAKSITEFVTLAKSKPGQMTYASSGTGSSSHLAVVLFESMTGTSFTHVPYKGTSPALADLLSGRVDFMIDNITTHSALAKQGLTRALGVSGLTPSQMLPGVPTISAAGVPGYDMSLWYAILGPAGMPADRVAKLSDDLRVVMSQQKMKPALEALGNEPMFLAPKELDNFIKSESQRWGEIVRKSGAKPQ
jgi:tripartite-type tricarboxylate transporter receptor subunit TctC